MRYTYGALAPRGALDGTWEVVEFRRDSVDVPPLVTDESRWRYFTIVDRPAWKQAIVTHMKGVNGRWRLTIRDGDPADTLELREMTVAAGDDASMAPLVGTLTCPREGEKNLRMTGEIAGARVEALCARREPQDFLLMKRGFHWVNEDPFNR